MLTLDTRQPASSQRCIRLVETALLAHHPRCVRAEAGSGTVRAVLTAVGGAGGPAEGSMVRVVFKALAPSDGTRIALSEPVQAVTPAGEPLVMAPPGEWLVKVK